MTNPPPIKKQIIDQGHFLSFRSQLITAADGQTLEPGTPAFPNFYREPLCTETDVPADSMVERHLRMLKALMRRALDDLKTRPPDTWATWEAELKDGYAAAALIPDDPMPLGKCGRKDYTRMKEYHRLNELDRLLEYAKDAWEFFASQSEEPYSYKWIADFIGWPQQIVHRLPKLLEDGHYMQMQSAQRHRVETGARSDHLIRRRKPVTSG